MDDIDQKANKARKSMYHGLETLLLCRTNFDMRVIEDVHGLGEDLQEWKPVLLTERPGQAGY